ncbi:MAG: U32 family peptidase, partial [Lachnospiraceae bacterium]|nr:U32 family peptidase [Lachnospiraceae bacterium]
MGRSSKPELLVPAGSLEVLKTAVTYGADAVYIGGEEFSLRAKAKNFSNEDMAEGIKYAHDHGVKVYVTANIYAHNKDIEPAREYLGELGRLAPDAILIADPGIFT